MLESEPKFIQELPEVGETEPGGKIAKAEVEMVCTTPQELQEKFGVILITEGRGMASQQDIENLDQALSRLIAERGSAAVKKRAVFLQPGNKNRPPEDLVAMSGASAQRMYYELKNSFLLPEIYQIKNELENIMAVGIRFSRSSHNLDPQTLRHLQKAVLEIRLAKNDLQFPDNDIRIVDDTAKYLAQKEKLAKKSAFPIYVIQWGDSLEQIRTALEETYSKERGAQPKT